MNKPLRFLKAAILPERCPYCGRLVTMDKLGCETCLKKFPEKQRLFYARGGYPCAVPFLYDDIFKQAVRQMKFNSHPEYAEKLSYPLADAVRAEFGDKIELITYVPMHKNQIRDRGYNQAKLLAERLSDRLKIPCEALLVKHKMNLPQHSLTANERKLNVRGVYKAVSEEKIKDSTVLVVDDIITTGCTLGECCRMLKKAKAKEIICAAVCARRD